MAEEPNTLDWTAMDVLFAICPQCQTPLSWKRHWRKPYLGAICCGTCYTATLNRSTLQFNVVVRHVDLTNVLFFPIVRDYGGDPGAA